MPKVVADKNISCTVGLSNSSNSSNSSWTISYTRAKHTRHKTCHFIGIHSFFRLLTTGTIEEKIYQRQINKQGLCDGIIDPQIAKSIKLSQEELKAIFTHCTTVEDCWTHDSLSCGCDKQGEVPVAPVVEDRACQLTKYSNSMLKMSELFHWEHHGVPISSELLTNLKLETSQDVITFIFHNCTVSD